MVSTRSRMVGLVLFTVGCQSMGGMLGGRGGGSMQVSGSCQGDLGTTAAAVKLENFIASSVAFAGAATELDTSLRTTCLRMGSDLRISANEMAATGSENPTQKACERVVREIRSEVAALRAATAAVRITVDVQPPRCEVSIDAYGRCAASCDASFTPGSADIRCEGGEIRGTCSGQCTGRCAAEVSGACAGACEGTCSGGCSGVCNGVCEGTCASRDARGNCNGACSGTCRGSCSAGCTGGCAGRCELSGQASCTGECRGGCSVAYTEPRCTGRVVPPRMSADCRASCDARLDAQATCTPAQAVLRVDGAGAEAAARVARLQTAVANNYGQILDVAARLARVGESGGRLAGAIGELPSAVSTLGIAAVGCATSAVAATAAAAASVSVSVNVSVSVSGSFQAGAQ